MAFPARDYLESTDSASQSVVSSCRSQNTTKSDCIVDWIFSVHSSYLFLPCYMMYLPLFIFEFQVPSTSAFITPSTSAFFTPSTSAVVTPSTSPVVTPSTSAIITPSLSRPLLDVGSSLPRQSTDFGLRLPQGWRQNVSEGDRRWIGRSLFVAKGKLSPNLKLWWYPPSYEPPPGMPSPETYMYHLKKLFLWMPRKMWRVDFHCPSCSPQQSLRSKGLYNHVRLVLDLREFYYLAGEYMDCRGCNGTFISWDVR